MPLLLRTAMEQRCMRRVALLLLHLSSLAVIGNVPAAAIFYNRAAMTVGRMALAQSRR